MSATHRKPIILILDPDPNARRTLSRLLQPAGHACAGVATSAEALRRARGCDLLLLDLDPSDSQAPALLQALRQPPRPIPALFLVARPSLEGAIAALAHQAHDYLPRTTAPEVLLAHIEAALRGESLGHDYLWRRLETQYHFSHVLSRNLRAREAYVTAARVARSRAPVVISGETGTGKEYLARALHFLSDRASQPFVTLNCGALPDDLLESELFGHEKGAFTSAASAQPGLCEAADAGTLFLDEIGEMSPALQVKLLRFLNDGSFRRLGGAVERQADVRVLVATHQDLPRLVAGGRFREDLFWRLNVIRLQLPPLRERPEDLEPFSAHFLARFALELGRPSLALAPAARRHLSGHPWPGNLRELHNVLWRATLLASGDCLSPTDLQLTDLAA